MFSRLHLRSSCRFSSRALIGNCSMYLQIMPIMAAFLLILQIVPNWWWLHLKFVNFMIAWKWYTFSINSFLNFELWSLPWASNMHKILEPQLVISYIIMSMDNQTLPFYTQTTVLVFTFSTVFNKLHEIFNTMK